MGEQRSPADLERFAQELQAQLLEEAGEQYSETVLRHWMAPKNPYPMAVPDGQARITGRCGDTMEIFLRIREGVITEASFVTDGCGTTIAAASMAVELISGKFLHQAAAVDGEAILAALGGLPADSEHCATLAAATLSAAVDNYLARQGNQHG